MFDTVKPNKSLSVCHPQEKQRFLTDVLHEVMLLDGLASSHPISQEVFEATDIDRVFDWIAYKKARSFSCMMQMIINCYYLAEPN